MTLAARWTAAGGAAALAITALEGPALARAGAAWLGLGTLALAIVAVVPGTLVGLAVLAWSRGARAAAWIGAGRGRRWVVGGLALAAGIAVALASARLYVRLYLAIHVAATIGAAGLVQLGVFALWPGAASTGVPARRARARVLLGAGVLAWMAALAGALAAIAGTPLLRFLALEQTTILAQGLLVLHQTWGVLAPAEGVGAPALPPLAPVAAPDGALRGANVLLVTVDSLRADAVPAGGTIAGLAARGVAFDRAWSPSCWTIHAMAATLTSRLPSQLRFTPVSIDPSLAMTPHAPDEDLVTNPLHFRKTTPVPWDDPTPTLAGLLRAAGYQTATPVGYVFYRPQGGLTREFELVDDEVYRLHNRDLRGVTSGPLTDAALGFLDRRDATRPFFLWVHYLDPHDPYVDHDGAGGDDRARYGSEVRHADRELGRLLDGLAARGLADDTLLVVHADHGEELGEHGGQYHATTLYEEILHVPLVIVAPARARLAAGVRAAPVSLYDLVPTIVDLLGVTTPAGFLGRSLVPTLRGAELAASPRFAECARFGRDRRAVLAWPWKLIADAAVGTLELYDLAADPHERANRIEDRPGDVTRLGALLGVAP